MADSKSVASLEQIEEQVQTMKWTLLRISSRSLRRKNGTGRGVVQATAGVLGKSFPRGTIYEQRLRRTWGARLKRLSS